MYQLRDNYIGNSVHSDHNPICIELDIMTEQQRGKGLWKFNTSLLTDAEYVKKIKDKIEECKQKYKHVGDHSLVWDTIKAEIRGVTIRHATYVSKQRNIRLRELNQELQKCEKALEEQAHSNTLQQYTTVKNEIEQINNHITKGI